MEGTQTGEANPRQRFVQVLSRFVKGMAECWPEREKLQTMVTQMEIICSTSVGVDRIVTSWFKYLQRPLDVEAVKYAAPVNRILARETPPVDVCIVYHAFAYNDVDVAVGGENPLSLYIELPEILRDPSFDAESRDAAMKYLRALNQIVYDCFDTPTPVCPSRADIAKEIQSFREAAESQKPPSSIDTAIGEIVVTLAKHAAAEGVGDAETLHRVAEGEQRDWMAAWHDGMRLPPPASQAYGSFYEACSKNAFDALASAPTDSLLGQLGLHHLTAKAAEPRRGECRRIVSQLNVLSQVNSKIPGEMQGRIEAAAQKIVTKLVSGEASLSSLDLDDIGNSILEGCDPEVLSSLASNIGSLLPELMSTMDADVVQSLVPLQQQSLAGARGP